MEGGGWEDCLPQGEECQRALDGPGTVLGDTDGGEGFRMRSSFLVPPSKMMNS